MPIFTANGIGIHYERTGGDRPPVVLLHGICDSSHCWPRVTAALEPSYDVIALDARGHGQSAAPTTGYNLEALADDVAGVISALGLKQPAVVGHSLGAMTAAELAARHPELARCIVLEDPPWIYSDQAPEEWAAVIDSFRSSAVAFRAMTSAQVAEQARRTNPRMVLWDKADVAGWVEANQRVSLLVMDDMRSHPHDWRSAVAHIACPALLLAGDPAKGGFCPPDVVREVRALNPTIVVVEIASAGHQLRREALGEYIDAVRSFLDAHTWA
jgi:N-formylmaleamate deformylase